MGNSQTYYLQENENVFEYFAKLGIGLPAGVTSNLGFISAKVYNNQIGYYQFKSGGVFHKFYVLPKVFENSESPQDDFFQFFIQYYQLAKDYPAIKRHKPDGNIVDLAFDKPEELKSKTIEEFINLKYGDALNILDRFFRKHNKTRQRTLSYTSQSIENRLDLERNIRSLDKSRVHQTKRVDESFSVIAAIATHALKYFKKEKLPQISEGADKLSLQTNAIANRIGLRFKSQGNFSFKDRDIVTNRVVKLFRKTKELREVHQALLTIIGLEHFKSDESSRQAEKMENMVAVFFRPDQMFEWVVYDHFKKEYPNAVIYKPGFGTGTSGYYEIRSAGGAVLQESKPDLIVERDEEVWVIDAKWKVLPSISAIQFADVAKLQRDMEIRKTGFGKKEVTGKLVYPSLGFEVTHPFSLSYSGFEFHLDQVKVAKETASFIAKKEQREPEEQRIVIPKQKLKGGVLLIGSLFWDKGMRENWRNNHLQEKLKIQVRVPIRYGRFSEEKGRTYTVVFDNKLTESHFGTAYFLPFKKDKLSEKEIIEEAERLSLMEGHGDNSHFLKGTDELWCACGILFKPGPASNQKNDILTSWKKKMEERSDVYKRFANEPEVYSMKVNGELDIPWPEELNDYDFLLATSTRPKHEDETLKVPEIEELVKWIKKKERDYFEPNHKKGITTFQDDEILRLHQIL